jgi:two-component system, response regulator PdtaR
MTRCLVVDDNTAFAENVAEILREWGEDPVVATTAIEALELLGGAAFDLLLSDFKMPVMDGVQLIREARRIQPKLMAIILSAYANDAVLEQARGEGCLAVLCKQPFPLEQLQQLFQGLPN